MPNKVKPPLNFAPFFHKRNADKAKALNCDKGFLRIDSCNPTDEAFSMHDVDGWQYHWNVTRARAMAEQTGHLFRFRPADFGLSLALVKGQYPGMDADYALTTDLSRPLLLTLFARHKAKNEEPNTLQLLDGWHRLFKALLTGVETLPAYLLTQEQADAVLFGKLPPGEGIDIGQEKDEEE